LLVLLLLLLDVVALPREDLLPVFEEFLDEALGFDLACAFLVAVAEVAGFVDWAMMPPVVVNASREPNTTANRTFNPLSLARSLRKACTSTVSCEPCRGRQPGFSGITADTLLQYKSGCIFDSSQSRVVLLSALFAG
jgi:hypothetical protein